MSNTVYIRSYSPPPLRETDILRYAGVREELPELTELIADCINEVWGKLSYRVCYSEFPVTFADGVLDLGFARTCSADVRKNLQGCGRVVLFAATVGIELDMLTAKYSRISPARALMLQAIGAERIESLCDVFCAEVGHRARQDGLFTRPRFSAGYGDLPIEFQKDIFRTLDCHRKIGLTLNESLLMSPSKSVTALIGLGDSECGGTAGCAGCGRTDCDYRRTV